MRSHGHEWCLQDASFSQSGGPTGLLGLVNDGGRGQHGGIGMSGNWTLWGQNLHLSSQTPTDARFFLSCHFTFARLLRLEEVFLFGDEIWVSRLLFRDLKGISSQKGKN